MKLNITTPPASDIAYFTYCERLWQDWLSNSLRLSSAVDGRFEPAYAPEPYLRFRHRTTPSSSPSGMAFLLTNPGKGIEIQSKSFIGRNSKPDSEVMSYAEASSAFAAHYQSHLRNAPLRRIDAMLKISAACGNGPTIQFETIPFHSDSLPGKKKLVAIMNDEPALRAYSEVLSAALEDRSIICLSAVPSSRPISPTTITRSPWLSYQAELMTIASIGELKAVSLVKKNRRATCAFLYEVRNKTIRGFVLMMGGNHFPGEAGLTTLIATIRRSIGS